MRREQAAFLGIISPRWMKATWGSDWSWEGGLPAKHWQVFTPLASWKPDIPASCLGAGTGDVGARGRGGSWMKTPPARSPLRCPIRIKMSHWWYTRLLPFQVLAQFVSAWLNYCQLCFLEFNKLWPNLIIYRRTSEHCFLTVVPVEGFINCN